MDILEKKFKLEQKIIKMINDFERKTGNKIIDNNILEIKVGGIVYYLVAYMSKWENVILTTSDGLIFKCGPDMVDKSVGYFLVFNTKEDAERFVKKTEGKK